MVWTGKSDWTEAALIRKITSRMNMLRIPAIPGLVSASSVSSLRLAAVSQPQKKKTPSATPLASPVKPPTELGLNHASENAREPAGWKASARTRPVMEKARTTRYSTSTITHWKSAVRRIP